MRTTVSSKGQVVLPADLRKQDKIAPGQQFDVQRVSAGEYLLKKVPDKEIDPVAWLFSCPVKGWFEPLASESTDTL